MSGCLTCALAEWQTTAKNKLHPSGEGRCRWKLTIILPAAFYWIGFGHKNPPHPVGGNINRREPYENCPTYRAKEPVS